VESLEYVQMNRLLQSGADPGGRSTRLSPENHESNFIHRDFV